MQCPLNNQQVLRPEGDQNIGEDEVFFTMSHLDEMNCLMAAGVLGWMSFAGSSTVGAIPLHDHGDRFARGEHLYLKLNIILLKKKIHVISVVFQDQTIYARTSFRGAKMRKIGEKGRVFGHIDKFWKGHDG